LPNGGATVPFTTPVLASSRLRLNDRQILDALIPGLSGTKGVYIVPFRVLPEMFKMSVHDRALHEEIVNVNAATPRQVRAAAVKVALTGLAGPVAAKMAREDEERAASLKSLTHFVLVVRVIEKTTTQAVKTPIHELATDAGRIKAKQALSTVAQSVGTSADDLYARFAQVGAIVAPLGSSNPPLEGPLRLTIKRIIDLALALGEWAEKDKSDSVADARLCAAVATECHRIVSEVASEIDRNSEDLGSMVRDWKGALEGLQRSIERLIWLLDGWDFLIKAWDVAFAKTKHDQREALLEMVRVLPVIPRNELNASRQSAWEQLSSDVQRQLKPLGEGAVGSIDLQGMLRLEKFKSIRL
jgi:hypothetical protein